MTDVHVIVPEGIDDPARPSGGNTYDRKVADGLAAHGWTVHEHGIGDLALIALRHVQQHDLPQPARVRHDRLGCGEQPVDQHHGAVGDPREVADAVLVHRPAERGEPLADPAIVRVATAGPPGVVDALGDDDVHLGHSGRS